MQLLTTVFFRSAVFDVYDLLGPKFFQLFSPYPIQFSILHISKWLSNCNLRENFTGRPEEVTKTVIFEVFRTFEIKFSSFLYVASNKCCSAHRDASNELCTEVPITNLKIDLKTCELHG